MENEIESKTPKRVRLTKDFVDFKVGMAYKAGTVLYRTSSGQYAVKGTPLGGGPCVAGLFLIKDICEPF
jgi:hypothetical protein